MQIRERHLRSRRNSKRSSHARRGALVLEFILTLPLLIIMLLAVIEFALVLQVNQIVAGASRHGAKLASEMSRQLSATPNLGNFNSGAPAVQLKTLIDQYLETHGLTESCAVFLEHNACGVANSNLDSPPNNPISNPASLPADCHCSGPATPPLPGQDPPADVAYVRVTVGVPMAGNVPNLLTLFGFDLGEGTFQQTTTMRLETNNQPPDVQVIGDSTSDLGVHAPIDGTSFPMNCGGNVKLANPLGTSSSLTTITLDFNSGGTTDPEQGTSDLTYQWTASLVSSTGSGASVDPVDASSSTFQVELGVPDDPNTNAGSTEDPFSAIYEVTLTVTDKCGAVSTCTQTIEIQTRDSDPE